MNNGKGNIAPEPHIITSRADSLVKYFTRLWHYRGLAITFATRDLKVKYAQTFLGLGWSIIQPATALLLFTFFFGYILKWDSGGLPFALYVFSGMLGWNLFTYIVYQGSSSVLESAGLIRKVYFPKLLLPVSKVLAGLVEMGISLVLLGGLMLWYGQPVSWHIIFLPVVITANIFAALALVTWIGALAYRMRDLFHLVPFLMYFGIWITPVFFKTGILPEHLQFIWSLNPMTGIVEGWRWCLFPGWNFNPAYLPSALLLIPLSLTGVWLYARNESLFSDYA